MLNKQDLEPIVKSYYNALEEGRILGRKCTSCGHVEFPPYLCCNECGCLDTEWVELNGMRGQVKRVLATAGAFGDPEFRKKHGDYWAIEIDIDGCDPLATSLLHVNSDLIGEFDTYIREHDVFAVPIIIQDEDVKVVVWELEGDSQFKVEPKEKTEETPVQPSAASTPDAAPAEKAGGELDAIAQKVIECAAMAYGVDASTLSLDTKIREELSNQSMKMIVMTSQIEEELDVPIEIPETNQLETIGDFVTKVKEKM